jgi:hypothetical protein
MILLLFVDSRTDLRWNNVGSVGARALMAALEHNHTLVSLSLDGNFVPEDIMQVQVTSMIFRLIAVYLSPT